MEQNKNNSLIGKILIVKRKIVNGKNVLYVEHNNTIKKESNSK